MRYQQGSIEEVKTPQGAAWDIRFTVDGKRPRFRIGLKSQFPTEAKASRAAQHIRDRVNSPSVPSKPRTFGEVISRYEEEEMPARYSTRRGYMQIHRLYLLPKWGRTPLGSMNTMEVRAWLLGLALSTRTRGHIHGQMRVLLRFSMLWGWLAATVNPMSMKFIEWFRALLSGGVTCEACGKPQGSNPYDCPACNAHRANVQSW